MEETIQNIIEFNNLDQNQIQEIDLDPVLSEGHFESVEKIVLKIKEAISSKTKIVVIGDYDADGVCATTIMVDTIRRLKGKCGYYIPNRLEEGYGLTSTLVERVFKRGYGLIITVDNGVKSKDAVDFALQKGIEVIITDHHQNDASFKYFLHPDVLPTSFSNSCGAMMAFLISRHLLNMVDKKHLILTMIATIADMMPVWNENRAVIRLGLEALNNSKFPAVERLIKSLKPYNETTIAFELVPKINSVGRLADQANINVLVDYFLTDNEKDIMFVASQVQGINDKRKLLSKTYDETKLKTYGNFKILIDESIHEGVTGLIAANISQRYNTPTLVFTFNGRLLKGSGRSPQGYNLFETLKVFSEYFENFGGHSQACGLSLEAENLDKIIKILVQEEKKELIVKEDFIEIEPENITFELINRIDELRPFGVGFVLPQFKINDFNYRNPVLIKNKYIKLLGDYQHVVVEAISFEEGQSLKPFQLHNKITILGNFRIDNYNNLSRINILVNTFDLTSFKV